MKRLLLLTSLLLVGCRPPPYIPFQRYTRTEDFDLEHARWLHAHCDLIRLHKHDSLGGSLINARGQVADLGNYAQRIGTGQVFFADGSGATVEQSLVYACDQPTPWPRQDGVAVSIHHKRQRQAHLPLACPEADLGRVTATFELVDAGAGSPPTMTSYVRYRVTPVVAIPPAREDEARAHGVIAGPRRSSVSANHVLCSTFRDALLALAPGGKAHVAAVSFPAEGVLGDALGDPAFKALEDPATSSLYQWDVELLEIGGAELLHDHVGLPPPGR